MPMVASHGSLITARLRRSTKLATHGLPCLAVELEATTLILSNGVFSKGFCGLVGPTCDQGPIMPWRSPIW